MSDIIKLSPEIIRALTRGLRPVVAEEIENFLSGSITTIPSGFESEFTTALKGIVQDIGVDGTFGSVETIAGEVAGLAEGGLVVGKTQQIVESLRDLISGSNEAERQRQRTRQRLRTEMRENPERFTRITQITPIEMKMRQDIEERLRIQRGEGKEAERFVPPRPSGEQKEAERFSEVDLTERERQIVRRRRPRTIRQRQRQRQEEKEKEKEEDSPKPPITIPILTEDDDKGEIKDKPEPKPDDEDEGEDDIITRSVARGLGFQLQRIPIKPVVLPDDTKSYNYVELVRMANANAVYQDNIFNTSYNI
jgi:hypothetical protein